MFNFFSFLDGAKTYIISAIIVASGAAEGLLGWDIPGIVVGDDWLAWILTGLGLGALKSAIKKGPVVQ